jgi:hypothetical protein
MPSRPVRAIVFATLAALFVAGAFTFPQAQEPGRSDRDGITLPAELESGDWFPGSPGAEIRARHVGGLVIETSVPGRLLVTRGLPVDPDACYTALVRARAATEHLRIAFYDENIRQLLMMRALPRTAMLTVHELRLNPADHARVTFVIIATEPGRAIIDWLRLVRRRC